MKTSQQTEASAEMNFRGFFFLIHQMKVPEIMRGFGKVGKGGKGAFVLGTSKGKDLGSFLTARSPNIFVLLLPHPHPRPTPSPNLVTAEKILLRAGIVWRLDWAEGLAWDPSKHSRPWQPRAPATLAHSNFP